MAITSLYDLTSTVLVEALSVGLPVICPDHYGFRDAIDESCGIKVGVDSLEMIREGMATAIRKLHDDETARRRLAQGALRKASAYAWSEAGALASRLYERQVAPREPREGDRQ